VVAQQALIAVTSNVLDRSLGKGLFIEKFSCIQGRCASETAQESARV